MTKRPCETCVNFSRLNQFGGICIVWHAGLERPTNYRENGDTCGRHRTLQDEYPIEVAAADQFKGSTANHRAGYTDSLGWALKIARKGGTLAAGEGLLIIEHYEAELKALQDTVLVQRDAIEQLKARLDGRL